MICGYIQCIRMLNSPDCYSRIFWGFSFKRSSLRNHQSGLDLFSVLHRSFWSCRSKQLANRPSIIESIKVRPYRCFDLHRIVQAVFCSAEKKAKVMNLMFAFANSYLERTLVWSNSWVLVRISKLKNRSTKKCLAIQKTSANFRRSCFFIMLTFEPFQAVQLFAWCFWLKTFLKFLKFYF